MLEKVENGTGVINLLTQAKLNGLEAMRARDLYSFLYDGESTHYSRWESNFITKNPLLIENEDYSLFAIDGEYKSKYGMGNKATHDTIVTINTAKQLCLSSQSEKGRQARQELIDYEEKGAMNALPDFSNPAIAARAWAEEYEKRELAEAKVKVLSPKAEYHDKVLSADNSMTISVIAEDLGTTAIRLNKFLSEKGVQYKRGGMWHLYANHKGKGYVDVETYSYNYNGSVKTAHSMRWTEKGRKFIMGLLNEEKKC